MCVCVLKAFVMRFFFCLIFSLHSETFIFPSRSQGTATIFIYIYIYIYISIYSYNGPWASGQGPGPLAQGPRYGVLFESQFLFWVELVKYFLIYIYIYIHIFMYLFIWMYERALGQGPRPGARGQVPKIWRTIGESILF